MRLPRIRRAAVILTLAGGTLFGGAIAAGHALAATKSPATPTPKSSSGSTSTTHNCPHHGTGSSAATASIGY